MKKTIEETTRLLMQGTLTKDEADKILLGLHNVSNLLTAFEEWQTKYPLVNLESAEWQLERFLSSL